MYLEIHKNMFRARHGSHRDYSRDAVKVLYTLNMNYFLLNKPTQNIFHYFVGLKALHVCYFCTQPLKSSMSYEF